MICRAHPASFADSAARQAPRRAPTDRQVTVGDLVGDRVDVAAPIARARRRLLRADAELGQRARRSGIEATRVGVKATTMEGLGFIGRGEGIAALASATVLLPGRAT